MVDPDVIGAPNPTPEACAREALRAAGWLPPDEYREHWRPGPRATRPKVGNLDVFEACRELMDPHFGEWTPHPCHWRG